GARPRTAHCGWPGYAAASSCARLREMVWRASTGHRQVARHRRRQHRGPHMLIVGLTGSIGMGKSTAAAHLRARGLPVFDADGEVHRLYAGGEAVDPVERAFPGTTTHGGVDRAKLSAALLAQPERFAELEAIVHPLVRNAE